MSDKRLLNKLEQIAIKYDEISKQEIVKDFLNKLNC